MVAYIVCGIKNIIKNNFKIYKMKNILLALVCLLSFSFKNFGDDKPKCCTDKCSKECIEMCKKNKCTDKDCCKDCATKGCKGKACTSAAKHGACCATADECKKKCAEGKCTSTCKVGEAKEGACCTKEHHK